MRDSSSLVKLQVKNMNCNCSSCVYHYTGIRTNRRGKEDDLINFPKCRINLVAALVHRHFAARLRPDRAVLNDLRKYIPIYLKPIIHLMNT